MWLSQEPPLADRSVEPLRGARMGQEWIADQFGLIRVVAVKIGGYAIEDGQGLPAAERAFDL